MCFDISTAGRSHSATTCIVPIPCTPGFSPPGDRNSHIPYVLAINNLRYWKANYIKYDNAMAGSVFPP